MSTVCCALSVVTIRRISSSTPNLSRRSSFPSFYPSSFSRTTSMSTSTLGVLTGTRTSYIR